MSKKFLFTVLICVCLFLSACTYESVQKTKSIDKPTIICTLFPQFDFARNIAGDTANVVMLLTPGMEAHMYDPTPADMKMIAGSDIFIYTGDAMEGWAAQIVESLDDSVYVLDLSQFVNLCEEEHNHDHDDPGHEHHDHDHSGYDPHYWLDMDNAAAMAQAIENALSDMFPEHETVYEQRLELYTEELHRIDEAFKETVDVCDHAAIAFGGRFAYSYFLKRYDLHYETVYHSCSAESDPSVSDVIRVIDYINENQIPIIFYEELSSGTVAKTIADDAGIETEVFTTGHNVTKEEFESGVTFIDLMDQNLNVLKRALERK